MSEKYKAENLIDGNALINAVEEISNAKNEKNNAFAKNYDPYTKMEEITASINEADKSTDKLALGSAGFSLAPATFLILINLFKISSVFILIAISIAVAIIIMCLFIIIIGNKNLFAISKSLKGHRFSYLDKMHLNILKDSRQKDMIMAICTHICLITFSVFSLIFLLNFTQIEYGLGMMFTITSLANYILIRNSLRRNNIKKVLDNIIE